MGTRIRRGPHWKWGDQDRNKPGTIVKTDSTPGQYQDIVVMLVVVNMLCYLLIDYFIGVCPGLA